jgi:putative Mg2+ transporter-C (MgtC) family protein
MGSFADYLSMLPDYVIRSVFALVCGGLIGLERERRGKPAGLRTNILICIGSAMYMIVGDLISYRSEVASDPARIAAQVVTGIGFIGAGTIIQSRGTITGLTSAAVTWCVAAIGITIGAGHTLLAVYFTLLILFVLSILAHFERRLLGTCVYAKCAVELEDKDGLAWARVNEVLREHDVPAEHYEILKKGKHILLNITYCERHASHNRFLFDLWASPGIRDVQSDLPLKSFK